MSAYLCGREFIDQNARGGLEARCGGTIKGCGSSSASQLAALHQYAKEASHGQSRLVLISGEAGVGKSVLLEELSTSLNGTRWLWAGCDGLFTPAALGPLLDIAGQLAGELLRLCRAEAKRDQLYGALLRQLGDLQALTVIAIEDVHWADEATLDLLTWAGGSSTCGCFS